MMICDLCGRADASPTPRAVDVLSEFNSLVKDHGDSLAERAAVVRYIRELADALPVHRAGLVAIAGAIELGAHVDRYRCAGEGDQ